MVKSTKKKYCTKKKTSIPEKACYSHYLGAFPFILEETLCFFLCLPNWDHAVYSFVLALHSKFYSEHFPMSVKI